MKHKETIEYLDIQSLVPFQNHPFKLRDGEEKERLMKSIQTQDAIEPSIVRPLSESEYEVISGHRRDSLAFPGAETTKVFKAREIKCRHHLCRDERGKSQSERTDTLSKR